MSMYPDECCVWRPRDECAHLQEGAYIPTLKLYTQRQPYTQPHTDPAIPLTVSVQVSSQCLWFAGPGVVINMLLGATLCYYVYPDDWSWNTCLIFGAIVAATDPVAVGAVLKELGAPENLATVIEVVTTR